MTQNVFGPSQQSVFQASRYQGEFTTLADLQEIVFSYSGSVSLFRESGFWVPTRRSSICQVVASMRVPRAVNIAVNSSDGAVAWFTFNPNVYVMTFGSATVVRAGSAGGWVRCVVTPPAELDGQDLVVMLRYLEIS
jgi:hypothetical protein